MTTRSAEKPRDRHVVAHRAQKQGIFRSDLLVSWHLAMVRAIAHAASAELRSGRIDESSVEDALTATALNALR